VVVLKEIKQVKARFPWLASTCEPSSGSLSHSTTTFAGIGSFLRFGFCCLLCGCLCCGLCSTLIGPDRSLSLLIHLSFLSENRELHKVVKLRFRALHIRLIDLLGRTHFFDDFVRFLLELQGLPKVLNLVVAVRDRLIARHYL
jgi:hypothetical protein